MNFKFLVIISCLVLGACASPLEKRLEITQEPADEVEYYFEVVYELSW